VERKLWELLAANVLILALIILAGIVSGWGEALAWLGGLLAMDVRIVSRWVPRAGEAGGGVTSTPPPRRAVELLHVPYRQQRVA